MSRELRGINCTTHYNAELPARVQGKHMWVIVSMHSVRPRENGEYILDKENLLVIDGPVCYWCEKRWSTNLEDQPCKGDSL